LLAAAALQSPGDKHHEVILPNSTPQPRARWAGSDAQVNKQSGFRGI
jgi:hypothetical protein